MKPKLLLSVLLIGLTVSFAQTTAPKREMRALWVTTLLNLDYPSSKHLSTERQKQEFINILDSMETYNFNTIVMQVRPSGEVLYPSKYEPWAEVLTGKQGVAPSPYYDPLKFMINESHKRNIDFHAWINPYRAVFNYKKAKLSANHPTKIHPEWTVRYGKHIYYNPALPETRDFIIKIVDELVEKYDIDAIHLDDYFYPYPIAHKSFPDYKEFKRYNPRNKSREEWRLDNVNTIIENIHNTIKSRKPWVQLGISPFGVWRNKDKDTRGSDTKAGQTNYDDLHADVLHWIKKGWVDYITPQIYWHIGHPQADYEILVKWWNKYTDNTNLYIGHALYKVGTDRTFSEWNTPREITRQINLNRSYPKIKGSMYFRAKMLNTRKMYSLKRDLKERFYKYPAIPPSTKVSLENKRPLAILVRVDRDFYSLSWNARSGIDGDALKYYIVYMFEGKRKLGDFNNPQSIIARTKKTELVLRRAKNRKDRRKRTFVITRVNKANQESQISNLIYKKL